MNDAISVRSVARVGGRSLRQALSRADVATTYVPMREDYVRGRTWHQSFERASADDSHVARELAHDGRRVFELDRDARFSPMMEISYDQITTADHAWLRISASVYPLNPVSESRPVLIVTFNHEGGDYKYRGIDLDRRSPPPPAGEWSEIELDYLTPEVRRSTDTLRVYFWLRGPGRMLVDDLRVVSYVPRP